MNKIQILVIEDNPGDFNLVRLYLKQGQVKCDLEHCPSFFDGMDRMDEKEFDLVLLDLSLPDIQGFKTLELYLEKQKKVPVIVLTGNEDSKIGNLCVKAGAQDYLVKGEFDRNLLSRVVGYGLQRHEIKQKYRETLETLKLNQRIFCEAQELAHFGNWEMDLVTNKMKWSNEVFRIFGFEINAMEPTLADFLKYVHRDDKADVEEFVAEASRDGLQHSLEFKILIEGTKIRHIAARAKVYYNDLNNQVFLIGTVQDISDKKLSQQLLVEKQISNKAYMLKEEILKEMSFHIRTPLSSLNNLGYLLNQQELPPQQKEYTEALVTSIDDLNISINNLINFSILLSDKLDVEITDFNFAEMIASLDKLVKIKTENNSINIAHVKSEQIPEFLKADSIKINQILINIIEHLVRHHMDAEKKEIKLYSNFDGKNLKFVFEDEQWSSLDSRIQELLTVEQLINGSGNVEGSKNSLNVAIALKLLEGVEGEIIIHSSHECNVRYEITIPAKVGTAPIDNGMVKIDNPMSILLVEDHFLNQLGTKKILGSWSKMIQVDIAENGEEAIKMFKENRYDLVLMDLQMPIMDGFEASIKIREFSKVPIIALSANTSTNEIQKSKKCGMNDYIVKPFKPDELFSKIASLTILNNKLMAS